MKKPGLLLIGAVVTLIHCQDEHLVNSTLKAVLHKLETISDKLKDISQGTGQCFGGDDLEHLTNVSAEAHQEIESFHKELSGIISLPQKGECPDSSLPCGLLGNFTCFCPPGFIWDGSDCADIDECVEGIDVCSPNAICKNSIGSYSCSCNPPFEGDGKSCSCPPGFATNGNSCEDIDECVEGIDVCSLIAICKNSIGSYSCSCNPPFEGDGKSCSCPPGFATNGNSCEDIDECVEGIDVCSLNAICKNSIGSYSCSCNPPFEGDGKSCSCPPGFATNGNSCEDIDECTEGKDDCVPNATCKNSIGSYSCSCNKHFVGDGKTSCEFRCRSPATNLPKLGCILRIKNGLSFQDFWSRCQRQGGEPLQHFTKNQMEKHFVGGDCKTALWVGVYDGKWISDGQEVPEDLWEVGKDKYNPAHRCGAIQRRPSSPPRLKHIDCSSRWFGVCMLQRLP
ncbi:protein kinase C-binding protein NELL2-like isoform X2 [Palaemon carinicauda]|uniref:protein kinase C-binding protein NELL2-like isoform X2 n=1 Tax=Palaemon carinicauda TaxID=392227 RepID=UPI0035B666BB